MMKFDATSYYDHYRTEVRQGMLDRGVHVMRIPRIEKVVLNMGIKKILSEHKNALDTLTSELVKITGQKPRIVRAKKANDSFSLKAGEVNALVVTLRSERMYSFLHRLLLFVLPRTKSYAGIPESSVDGSGNISFGLSDHTVFYEIDRTKSPFSFGFNVTVCTSEKNRELSKSFLKEMCFPLV